MFNPFVLATADSELTALGTSVGTYVKENAWAVITANLPLGLAVGGGLLVVFLAWRFIKKLVK